MITSDTAGTDESSQPVGLQFSNGIEGNKNPSGYVDGTLFALGTAAIIGGRIGYSIERRRENK